MLPIEAPRRQRNRIGKKTIGGKFDPAVARAFAILAVKEDATIEAMLTEAVLDILQKYKQPIER
ncbi:ribbon-helix-helix domain-containing protein [Mesorhizobium sp.]|uniref:ribbon-helix-helix domain-containing protein n=1 Tax=Mesorhizobium sp. TaxID=1871066 RepID=UPI0025D4E04D|nr:ribbon-helix-helix domain-containing protein [Mesorhizobium sp.]